MLIALLLPLLASQADQVIARNLAYQDRFKTLSVSVEVKSSKMPGTGVGKLSVKRPGQVYFDMNWGDEHYTLYSNPKRAIEIDHVLRIYAELEPTGRVIPPSSEISSVPAYGIPVMILGKGVKPMLPPEAEIKFVGRDQTIGIWADHLNTVVTAQGARLEVDMWYDDKGAMREYRIDNRGPQGRITSTMKLSNYQIDKPLPDSMFVMAPPLGYSPNRFVDGNNLIQKGETLNIKGFVDPQTSKPFSLMSKLQGQYGVVAILGGAEPASEALLKWLLSGAVKSQILIFAQQKPSTPINHPAIELFVDPAGKALAAARAPGTPLWMVVDAKGAVVQVWYGFDIAFAQQYVEEVNATITTLKSND